MNKRRFYTKRMLMLSLLTCACCLPGQTKANDASAALTERNSIENILQNRRISGVVKDSQGPITGANVSIKGTTIGAITDINGKFSFDAPQKGVLVISFIGYITQEISVEGKNEFSVILKEDTEILDEVVVTGYIAQKKVNLTGAISSVNGEELTKITATSSAQALQGKLPGVQITAGDGAPGSASNIQVRGIGSVMSGTQPLVIVDGFEGTLDNIAMRDIETISVLKDAASAAIYGSKAANGVILITTKRGKIGAMQVEVSAEYGWQSVSHMPDVLNATEMAIKQNEEAAWSNQTLPWSGNHAPETLGKGFNWWDYAYKNDAPIQNYYLSMKGGTEKAKYAISAGYIKQEGVIHLTDYDRFNFRSNFDYAFNKKFKIGVNIEASIANTDSREDIYHYSKNALLMHPSVPQYMLDGSYGLPLRSLSGQYDAGQAMPLSMMYLSDPNYVRLIEGNTFTTRANFFLEWEILKGLKFKSVYNQQYIWSKKNYWKSSYTVYDYETPESIYDTEANAEAISNYSDSQKWEIQELFTYNRTFAKKHTLGVLAGFTAEKAKSGNLSGKKTGFPGNELRVIDAGNTIDYLNGSMAENSVVSLFGQVNYDYMGKYLFQANIRRDGSSVFAPGNQWGTFPSVSIGWRISEEEFMKKISWLNNLKLRIGYGTLGNANIKSFAWVSSYKLTDRYPLGAPNAIYPAYYQTDMSNKDIKWESTTTTNVGIDATVLDNRLNFTFDWYDKRTNDMLFTATIPYSTGYLNGPVINVGEVMNRGWEISASWNDNIKKFHYGISINLAHNKNEVTDMGGVAPFQIENDLWIKEGYPINSYFGYKTIGIYQNWDEVNNSVKPNGDIRPGNYIIQNTNGDDKIDTEDKTFLGSRDPKLVYGINLTAEWQGIDLSVATSGESKKCVYYDNSYGGVNPRFCNIYKEYFDNRTIVGEDGNVTVSGKYPAMAGLGTNAPEGHKKVMQNTSFFRIKNIQIGYTLPQSFTQKMRISNLRIFFNAVNPFLFTKYVGFDPETTSTQQDGTVRYYPVSKSVSMGLSLKF